MAKAGKEKVEQGAEVPEQPEATPEKSEVQPPAPSLDELKTLLAEAEEKARNSAEEAKRAKEEVDRKEKVILRQQERLRGSKAQVAPEVGISSIPAIEATIRALEAQQVELGEPNPQVTAAIATARAALAAEQQRQYQAQQQARWQEKIEEEEQELADEMEARGFIPQSEGMKPIWEKFRDAAERTGDFNRPYRMLDRVKKEAKPQEPPKGKEESEEEKERKILAKYGYLKSDTGGPSGAGGASFTREQIANMSPEEFAKLKPEIDKARKEGRIK